MYRPHFHGKLNLDPLVLRSYPSHASINSLTFLTIFPASLFSFLVLVFFISIEEALGASLEEPLGASLDGSLGTSLEGSLGASSTTI